MDDIDWSDDENPIANAIKQQMEYMDSPEGQAEMKAQAIERIKDVEEQSIHKWSDELHFHSFPSVWLPLSTAEMKAIFQLEDGTQAPEIIKLEKRIMKKMEFKECYPRLSSRSPKDTFYTDQEYGMKCKTAKDVLYRLSGSMRIHDDLTCYLRAGITPQLILRKWYEIPEYQEFRVFVLGRRLLCISQMFYRMGAFKELRSKRMFVWEKAEKFLGEVAGYLPTENCVIDMWVPFNDYPPKVIETNPWNPEKTDPCLFKWDEILSQRVGGEVRIVKA